MNYGLQLFGCMRIFRKKPSMFFEQIAQMGYSRVEPCIAFGKVDISRFGGLNPFWNPSDLKDHEAALQQNGLTIDSFHAFGDLQGNLAAAEHMAAYGIKHVIMGMPRENLPEVWQAYAAKAKAIAKDLSSIGLELLIHNGSGEIRTKLTEKPHTTILEATLEACDYQVGVQLDTGWALFGGEDPVDFMNRISRSLRSVHYKDIKANHQSLTAADIHVGLGKGCLDVQGVHKFACKLGLPQLVDQDCSDTDLMQDLKESIELLRSFD